MRVDTIIVGQGLAGSLLAWNLKRLGNRVLVVDKYHEESASMVAAGIVNPITGPRLTPCWQLELLLAEARHAYGRLSEEFDRRFLTECQLVRLFRNEEEQHLWMHKRTQSGTAKYLGAMRTPGWKPGIIDDPFGSFTPGGSGYLRIAELLVRIREWLKNDESLVEASFQYDHLALTSTGVKWKDWEARQLIFCEGYQAINNPYFNYLPFKSSKGEVLEVIAAKGELPEVIINRGKWLLPLGEGRFKAGSTFTWDPINCEPTEEGKAEILSELNSFIKVPLDVVGHAAGVRPTMKDLRPILGMHPKHPHIGILNGLGAKGALMAPYFAAQFASSLAQRYEIDREVDISRFAHLL